MHGLANEDNFEDDAAEYKVPAFHKEVHRVVAMRRRARTLNIAKRGGDAGVGASHWAFRNANAP
jgi:hypothetical protein